MSQAEATETSFEDLMSAMDGGAEPPEPREEEDQDAPAPEAEEPDEKTPAAEDEAPEDEEKTTGVTDESKVKLDDGREVSVAELKKTFSTFQRKTQEYAESHRQNIAQAREAVAKFSEQQAYELHNWATQIRELVAPGVTDAQMQRLAYEDPTAYHQIAARVDSVRRMQDAIGEKVRQNLSAAAQQREQAAQEHQRAHQELLQTEGERLKSQKWFNQDFLKQAMAYASKHNIPEQVASGVAYAGFYEITRKAMLYDEAVKKGRAAKQAGPAMKMSPGAVANAKTSQIRQTKDLASRAARGDYSAFGALVRSGKV